MGKKSRYITEPGAQKNLGNNKPFSFLGTSFNSISNETAQRHILLLVAGCILMKFVVVFLTTAVFHSFVDYFDIGTYFERALPLLQGQIPYVNYQIEYPVLAFIPILIAFIPAILTKSVFAFVLSFQFLMIICDIITTLSVYLIALKIWDEKRAFYSALIYLTALSSAYFVITKFDAFPTCLLMLALLFTIYGMRMKGYLSAGFGFFVKIFPAIAFPFLILYNSKTTSLKKEIIDALKIIVPLLAVLLVPFFLLRPEILKTYLFASGSGAGVYANTLTYTIFCYVREIGHLGVTADGISIAMYILMGVTLVALLWSAYRDPEKMPETLIVYITCALISAVLFTKFHSPQYIVWYTPLLALLVADDLTKVILFYLYQILAYIEFPLMFGTFYTNLEYTSPAGSIGWYGTLFFFTAEFFILLLLVYFIVRPKIRCLVSSGKLFGGQKTDE